MLALRTRLRGAIQRASTPDRISVRRKRVERHRGSRANREHGPATNFVKVGGSEEWLLSGDLLVREWLGRYDAVEYERQVAHGA